MKIDELTIGEARHLAALFQSQTAPPPCPYIGRHVVVRTYAAGVHAGVLRFKDGQSVLLSDSRRIWSWTGALSCSEIAVNGITGGKVACVVLEQCVEQAIEILPTSVEAEKCLRNFK